MQHKPRLDPKTLPPAVHDSFNRALMEAASALLDDVDFKLVLAEFIDTAPSVSLPALTRELSLEDIIEPGLSEAVQRRLLKRWYELHEAKGTLYGVRLALSLLGMQTQWTQWYEKKPKGKPGTHRAIVFPKEAIFDAQDVLLDPRMQQIARRAIENYKRKSQDVELFIGLSNLNTIHPVLTSQRSSRIRVNGPQLTNQDYSIPTYAGGGAYVFKHVRITAKGGIYG
ncbi:phage tail protein I [Bartonella sp. HY761]|uniref:phage tail protein I n=1 Tax=Bartonella sp. HY761 TaxID=2979330 RepID=UPI0021FC2808|nr:phage tail protein I [Bartonella sp. HY761]UXN07503.1 phage tail protein I [Bartonella sp. HY761]